jgi:AraC-like DNA-binding protein
MNDTMQLLKEFESLDDYIDIAVSETRAYVNKKDNKASSAKPLSKNPEKELFQKKTITQDFLFKDGQNIAVSLYLPGTKFSARKTKNEINKTLHNHEFYEINYVYRGGLTNYLSDSIFHQGTNKILLMNKYAYHSPIVDNEDTLLFNILIRAESSAECPSRASVNSMSFLDMFLDASLGMSPLQPYIVFNNTPMITFLFHQIIREYFLKKQYYEQVLYSDIIQVWSMLARQKNGEIENKYFNKNYMMDVNVILSYIQFHYMDATLESVAKKFNFSANYLSRYIQKLTGYKFYDIIHHFKMQNALIYLVYSNYSLSEITDLIGYNDVSYFNKVFKKKYGITPGQYRNSNQNQENVV